MAVNMENSMQKKSMALLLNTLLASFPMFQYNAPEKKIEIGVRANNFFREINLHEKGKTILRTFLLLSQSRKFILILLDIVCTFGNGGGHF